MTYQTLRDAIELMEAGNKDEARKLLNQVLEQDPENEMAWLWYVETLTEDDERIQALEQYLVINPDSEKARRAYELLKQRQERVSAVELDAVDTVPEDVDTADEQMEMVDEPRRRRNLAGCLPTIVTIGIFVIILLAFALFILLLFQINILR